MWQATSYEVLHVDELDYVIDQKVGSEGPGSYISSALFASNPPTPRSAPAVVPKRRLRTVKGVISQGRRGKKNGCVSF